MRHLIVSREYPPAPYAPGGIGVYVAHIARLLAERGETVHVLGERWYGAPKRCESLCDGRLIVHRIAQGDLTPDSGGVAGERRAVELAALRQSNFPNQWFSWQAAYIAEKLIEEEGIDVVEGQEWEAPLYYLVLRRALGLGPERQPPCIVHLHSPTEFIARFNGVDLNNPEQMTMKRMEDYCIEAADALLCPSEYLAGQCERHYNLRAQSIEVIRYPVGFMQVIERAPSTWASGSICFVGRLEPRKGVIEWVEAAARVAPEHPHLHFDFVGADGWQLTGMLRQSIPGPLRRRFRFHGSHPRNKLPPFLSSAMAAVVPSRWDNFPNTCIEAMSSGLPVMSTRLGGMVELIEDGQTGWLAPGTDLLDMVDGLTEALRRCLATTPAQRKSMGVSAAAAVRRICDNEWTTSQHIAFRAEVARLGAGRSRTVPSIGVPAVGAGNQVRESTAEAAGPAGLGIIVWAKALAEADSVLESIRHQTAPPRVLLVVCSAPPSAAVARRLEADGGSLLVHPASTAAEGWNAGFAALAGSDARAWLFLDRHDRLFPDCLERLAGVVSRYPAVGIVSFWSGMPGQPGRIDVTPCPKLPYQWVANDVASASAFRAEAIGHEPPFRPQMRRGYDTWDLANAILGKGWSALTYPGYLAERSLCEWRVQWIDAPVYRVHRNRMLQRYPEAVARDAPALLDLFVPIPFVPVAEQAPLWRGLQLRRIRSGLRHPWRIARRLLGTHLRQRHWL